MRCAAVRRRLSDYRDAALPGSEALAVAAHLESCADCTHRWRSLGEALALLGESPRLACPEGVAPRVLARLEVESRGPGLALLFRPTWAARPLMLPSLLPAMLVFVAVLGGALALDDPGPLPPVATRTLLGVDAESWGTESYPLATSAEVSAPRARDAAFSTDLLAGMAVGTLFVETVVARDGSVSTVTLLDGDQEQAEPLLEALRRERFEPARFRGRPVAVSLYRLISRMEVRAPIT